MTGRVTRRLLRLGALARARAGSRHGRAAVLLYHRVATPSIDEWGLSVSPATFERHMEVLAADYRPLALGEVLAGLDAGTLPDRAVAVTFDDGYVDNLEAALPVLERHSVPATVYVATSYIGRGVPFWWDEIEHLLMKAPAERPDRIDLPGGPAVAALADAIQPAMRATDADGVERILETVRDWAGAAPDVEDTGRCVTADELNRLAASPLIEVGAHTHRHPSLRALSDGAASEEIARSRQAIAEHLGSEPAHFSYPFGDLRRSTPALVRDAGFESAVATDWGIPVTRAANRLRLPRDVVPDEPAEAFDRRVAAMTG